MNRLGTDHLGWEHFHLSLNFIEIRPSISYFDGWLSPQTYAANADAWSALSSAPPIGGIDARYFFGDGTPSVITFKIPAKLPSLHNRSWLVRGGASDEWPQLTPWQPPELAPPTV